MVTFLVVANRSGLMGNRTKSKQKEAIIDFEVVRQKQINSMMELKTKEVASAQQRANRLEKKLAEVTNLTDEETEEEEGEYAPLTVATMNWNVAAKLAVQFGFNAEGLKNPLLQNMIVEQLNKNPQYRRMYEGYLTGETSTQPQDIATSVPPQNWI